MKRDYLEQYRLLDKTIERCSLKLQHYLTQPIKAVSGTVQTSLKEFPYTPSHLTISAPENLQAAEKRDELVRVLVLELLQNQKKYEEMRIYIDLWLESLEDLEIKEILNQYYLDRKTYEEIGDDLGFDRTTICKKMTTFFDNQQIQQNEVVL